MSEKKVSDIQEKLSAKRQQYFDNELRIKKIDKELKGDRGVGYKVGMALAYIIPLMILLYVVYMNVLPFGYSATYTLDVGALDDTDCSNGICIKSWEGSEPMRVGEKTFRTLEGQAEIEFEPGIVIDNNTEVKLEVEYEGGRPEIKFGENGSWIPLYIDEIDEYTRVDERDGVNVYVRNKFRLEEYQEKKDYIAGLIKNHSSDYFLHPRYYFNVFSDNSEHLVLDMPFDEPPVNGTVLDRSGNYNHGVLGGGNESRYPEWVYDNATGNGYYKFDGKDDFIEVADVNISKELFFSVKARFASDPSKSNTKIFSDNRQYGIYARGSSNDIRFFIQRPNGYCDPAIIDDEIIEVGEWYEFTGTYDGKQMKFYLNQKLKDVVNCSGEISNRDNRIFAIGRREDLPTQYHKGDIGFTKISRTIHQIQTLLQAKNFETDKSVKLFPNHGGLISIRTKNNCDIKSIKTQIKKQI